MPNLIVVAGALVEGATLLVAQRAHPPELAGLWELPGGKVAPGETDAEALVRELREELGVEVTVGDHLGPDVALSATATLRAYAVTRVAGEVAAREHRAVRWIGVDGIGALAWVPADRAWLPRLRMLLGGDAV